MKNSEGTPGRLGKGRDNFISFTFHPIVCLLLDIPPSLVIQIRANLLFIVIDSLIYSPNQYLLHAVVYQALSWDRLIREAAGTCALIVAYSPGRDINKHAD